MLATQATKIMERFYTSISLLENKFYKINPTLHEIRITEALLTLQHVQHLISTGSPFKAVNWED